MSYLHAPSRSTGRLTCYRNRPGLETGDRLRENTEIEEVREREAEIKTGRQSEVSMPGPKPVSQSFL